MDENLVTKWFDMFWEGPVPAIVVAVLVIAVLYYAFVKKEKVAEAVVKTVIGEYVNIAADKGVTVEIFVDNAIARAIAKVKEKPDAYDPLVLAFLQSKFTRNKLISIIKEQVKNLTGEDAIDGTRPTEKTEETESNTDC